MLERFNVGFGADVEVADDALLAYVGEKAAEIVGVGVFGVHLSGHGSAGNIVFGEEAHGQDVEVVNLMALTVEVAFKDEFCGGVFADGHQGVALAVDVGGEDEVTAGERHTGVVAHVGEFLQVLAGLNLPGFGGSSFAVEGGGSDVEEPEALSAACLSEYGVGVLLIVEHARAVGEGEGVTALGVELAVLHGSPGNAGGSGVCEVGLHVVDVLLCGQHDGGHGGFGGINGAVVLEHGVTACGGCPYVGAEACGQCAGGQGGGQGTPLCALRRGELVVEQAVGDGEVDGVAGNAACR